MTIRRGPHYSKSTKAPRTPKPLAEDAERTLDIMTARHTRILGDFYSGKPHPPTCVCWLCLWRLYEKSRPVGHPYDFLTFLACDFIDEINDPFQNDAVKKIPIRRLATCVIGQLPTIGKNTRQILNIVMREQLQSNFPKYVYRGRYRADRLSILREELALKIHRRALKMPELIVHTSRSKSAGYLIQKIVHFVYSRPGQRATQREIQRHTNKRKADLEALHAWLKTRYGIIVPECKKWESVVYIGTWAKKSTRRGRGRPTIVKDGMSSVGICGVAPAR